MDGSGGPSRAADAADTVVHTTQTALGYSDNPGRALADGLGPGDFSLIALFASPTADLTGIRTALAAAHPTAEIIGCTTAGEIAEGGYVSDHVVAIALPRRHFAVEIVVLGDLGDVDTQTLAADVMRAQSRLTAAHPDWTHEFGFLMIDGLSLKEDEISAALSTAMGPAPFFGGSAGDGLNFGETRVLHNDALRSNAAVFAVIRGACPVRIFKIDHLTPTETKMVVTGADPVRRIVSEINAESAAKEYARILGKDPAQLSPFIFAAHPLLVRIGGQKHVRSIQRVLDNGDLVFFSAIDEGVVLTLADAEDIAGHLEESLGRLSGEAEPAAIIACDCILRRLEAEQNQASHAVSRILSKQGVVGFNTYGEQVNGAHVNQTLTGIAIYPPEGS